MTRNRLTAYRAGLRAERLCALLLRLKGYRIVAKRWKNPLGEIDLLAARSRTLVIIEVKRRPSRDLAAESISRPQRQRLGRAARFALAHWPEFSDHVVRFDAMLVGRWGFPHHIENAWDEHGTP